ncbi:N-acetylglucosamine-6-phosphate deacetylase [Nakamurella lactea]|uniref:N-acetylglucosamine-6-phosphate deacetylase n=1 Tax=Nakamurella lactea TaxID=459515 RepID=UPI0003FEE68D|nr:N-acetylglucosamine-6-phosphate deacetylase [Nakamurella lactea]
MTEPTRTVFTDAMVVTADAVFAPGWVALAGDRIVGVGERQVPAEFADGATNIELAGRWLLPGFIDLHVHGAAGATFDAGAADIAAGLAAHRRHGTTRSLVSLVTASIPELVSRVSAAAAYAAGDPHVLGLHLEGPFLSELRRGVHDPALLRAPEPAALEQLLVAGDGQVRVLTLAPELDGGLTAVRFCVSSGVHAAVGHSDADYPTALAAFEAGADLVTHAFNGMRPLHHRDPAIIGAAMDAGVVLEAINDGVHLHPATVRLLRSIAPGRVALVTDAMAAAGAADGDYSLAGFDVRVSDGGARLVTDDPAVPGSIAGSTLTMDVAVRRAVQDVGLPVVEAVAAASLVPARLLGVERDHGSIAQGRIADLVVADPDWSVEAVMVGGKWADERRPEPPAR